MRTIYVYLCLNVTVMVVFYDNVKNYLEITFSVGGYHDESSTFSTLLSDYSGFRICKTYTKKKTESEINNSYSNTEITKIITSIREHVTPE